MVKVKRMWIEFKFKDFILFVEYHLKQGKPLALTLFMMGIFGAAQGLEDQKGPRSIKSVAHIHKSIRGSKVTFWTNCTFPLSSYNLLTGYKQLSY